MVYTVVGQITDSDRRCWCSPGSRDGKWPLLSEPRKCEAGKDGLQQLANADTSSSRGSALRSGRASRHPDSGKVVIQTTELGVERKAG